MYHEITVAQELEVGCVAVNRKVYMVYKAYMKFKSALDCVFDLKFIVINFKKAIYKLGYLIGNTSSLNSKVIFEGDFQISFSTVDNP